MLACVNSVENSSFRLCWHMLIQWKIGHSDLNSSFACIEEWHGLAISVEACHSKGPEFKSSSGRFFWGDINHIKKTLIIWHENDKNTLSASNVEILLIWNIAKRSGRWIWSQVTWERKKKMVRSMWEVWLNGYMYGDKNHKLLCIQMKLVIIEKHV